MNRPESSASSVTAVAVSDLSKRFGTLEVLREVSCSFSAGTSVAITGPSGSGKSTLLHILGTLESPSGGAVRINDTDPFALSEPELARYRNTMMGFVFQDHHLLPQYTVLENVLVPTLAFPQPRGAADTTERARELLEQVGLTARLSHRPGELSGGERQRVAIARALINRPGILLCDEPTGNLDAGTAESVVDLLFALHRAAQNILIVVTHNPALTPRFQQHLQLLAGQLLAG